MQINGRFIMSKSKEHSVCFNAVADNLALVACEIPRNSPKIRNYSSSRSSKLIDLGVNRKPVCNFLLVIRLIVTTAVSLAVFKILTHLHRKTARFPQPTQLIQIPTPVWRPLAQERPAISTYSIHRWKVNLFGYNSSLTVSGLHVSSFV